jgi:protein TonB
MSVQSVKSPQEPSRLGIAFIAALLLHGTALAALTLWHSKESVTPPGEQEITIDLAPAMQEAVSVAPQEMSAVESPPVETEPLPVEPETLEAQPPEEPVEDQPQGVTALEEPPQVTEVAPVEAVPAEPATPETEAVVALPPPETVVAKPLEEKPAPKPEKKPPPKPVERKPVERKPTPRREVAQLQQPPSQARQGQASASRENMGGSAASADPNALSRYRASLNAALKRRLRYPSIAQSQGIRGTAHVRFTLDRSGTIVSSSIVRSSGHPALDQAALAAASPGATLLPVPDFIPQPVFIIPLGFDLR